MVDLLAPASNMQVMSRMPAVFLGHGSPMNTLEHNRYTQSWNDLGRRVGKPKAVLAVSAHWYVNATAVTAMDRPKTIHDFYGFPDELFAFQYPAPGSPALAGRVAELLSPVWVGMDVDSWGLDHGTWSVLAHVFPGADVPVVQLSIDAQKSFEDHVALGRALAPLQDEGVMVVASGNIVHNLRMIRWDQPEAGFDWAVSFDTHVRDLMATDPAALAGVASHPGFGLSVPTPDHFIPALYLAGMADAQGKKAGVLEGGYAMGSLSMTSYVVD